MKKWLIGCLMALVMVCLMGITANAETVRCTCAYCGQRVNSEILGYARYNDDQHWVTIRCPNCKQEYPTIFMGGHADYSYHSGGTETPTCTTGKTCSKCGAQYGVLGHDWGEWQSSGDNRTHTRPCMREGCDAVDTENCGGDGNATCVNLGTCTDCGGKYYSGHAFPERWKWNSETEIGRDAEQHWLRCLNCAEGKAHEANHFFSPGNMYLKSEATCISLPVYYMNCSTCYYKGTDTYVYQWGQLDPNNHDGGTEVKNAKAATCTEKGYTGDTYCKGCGVKLSDGTDIPALNHDLVRHDAKAPTCTEIGWNEYDTCQREGCGYTTYAEIPALNHNLVRHDAKAPTCTEIGWNEYATCQREGCGYTTYRELPALDHDLTHHDAKAPTCTEIGWNEYDTCSRCDYTTYVEKPALGHWYGEWTPDGSAAHSAACIRGGCRHTGHADCAALACTRNETTVTLCPVCGDVSDGSRLALVAEAAATGRLPAGALVLRMGETTDGDILMTVAFELAGEWIRPAGEITFTLPAALLEGRALHLISADGTEAELPFETSGDTLSFTLDFAALDAPAALLRLTPTA